MLPEIPSRVLVPERSDLVPESVCVLVAVEALSSAAGLDAEETASLRGELEEQGEG